MQYLGGQIDRKIETLFMCQERKKLAEGQALY